MNARDYGPSGSPDIHDTFEIREFDDERIATSNDYSYIQLHNNNATGAYSGDGIKMRSLGGISIGAHNSEVFSDNETRIESGDKVSIDAVNAVVFGAIDDLSSGPTIYPNSWQGGNGPTAIHSEVIRIVNGSTYQDWQVYNGMLCHVVDTGDTPSNITYGTQDLTSGSSTLATGTVYLVYE